MEEEVTQEELERCYLLGRAGAFCSLQIVNIDKNPDLIKREDIDKSFQNFRQQAQAYNIVLPEQLSKESSERSKTFHDHYSNLQDHFRDKKKDI